MKPKRKNNISHTDAHYSCSDILSTSSTITTVTDITISTTTTTDSLGNTNTIVINNKKKSVNTTTPHVPLPAILIKTDNIHKRTEKGWLNHHNNDIYTQNYALTMDKMNNNDFDSGNNSNNNTNNNNNTTTTNNINNNIDDNDNTNTDNIKIDDNVSTDNGFVDDTINNTIVPHDDIYPHHEDINYNNAAFYPDRKINNYGNLNRISVGVRYPTYPNITTPPALPVNPSTRGVLRKSTTQLDNRFNIDNNDHYDHLLTTPVKRHCPNNLYNYQSDYQPSYTVSLSASEEIPTPLTPLSHQHNPQDITTPYHNTPTYYHNNTQ